MIAAKREPFMLRRAVQVALKCSDQVWYHHMVKNDISGCKLSDGEALAVVGGAMRTAEHMAESMRQKSGRQSAHELAAALGLTLVQRCGDLEEPYLNISLYEPGSRTISINDSAILLVRHFIGANGLEALTSSDVIVELALFHEIFHALEEDTPDIYTRSKMIKRKVLGMFSYSRGLNSVSEVGAVHFSKCMTDAVFSPGIYDRYLLLALDLLSIDFLPPTV